MAWAWPEPGCGVTAGGVPDWKTVLVELEWPLLDDDEAEVPPETETELASAACAASKAKPAINTYFIAVTPKSMFSLPVD